MSLFILFWQFRVIQKIAGSIAAEYASRNLPVEARPTYQIGLWYCICSFAGLILGFMPELRILVIVVGLAILVLWIMYWVKTAEYKNAMKNMPEQTDEGSMVFQDLY